jgi:hypothetical protein
VGAIFTSTPYDFAFTLEWLPITLDPAADDFPGAELVTNNQLTVVDCEWATAELDDPWWWVRVAYTWWFWPEIFPSNRTVLFNFTPDLAGPGTITFQDFDQSYSVAAILFDGDGVTSLGQLNQSRIIASRIGYYSFVLNFTAVAGKKYYLWVTGDDGNFGPDAKFRFKVRWPAPIVGPVNDLFPDFIDLDDGLWHNELTTEGATNETFRKEQTNAGMSPADVGTIWFRMTTLSRTDIGDTTLQYRNAARDWALEYYQLEPISEALRSFVDTGCTITDGLIVEPRESWEIGDIGATIGDALFASFHKQRALADRGFTAGDQVSAQKLPTPGSAFVAFADNAMWLSESFTRRVTRRKTDTGASVSGQIIWMGYVDRVGVTKPRSLADTACTIGDSGIGVVRTKVGALSDVAVTFTETLTRTAVLFRSLIDTGATVSDGITGPMFDWAVWMTGDTLKLKVGHALADTAATISDVVGTRFREEMSDTAATIGDTLTRPRVARFRTDTPVSYGMATSTFITKVKRKPRAVTDTACTISDGIS